MATVRCSDCRRRLRVPPARDPETGLPYGPCCAERRGLTAPRRPRAVQPKRTTDPEQPSLLDHLNETTNNEGVMTMTNNAETPQHLQPETTDRGFGHLPRILSEYSGDVRVYESSAADGPHVWLKASEPEYLADPDGPTREVSIHLTAENAWQLADQLRYLVEHHYQGDARPERSR